MNKLRSIFIAGVCCVLAAQSHAQLIIRAAVLDRNADVNCCSMELTITKPDVMMPGVVTSGTRGIGWGGLKGSCQRDTRAMIDGTNKDCAAVSLKQGLFYTTREAPACLDAYISDGGTRAAVEAALDNLLNRGKDPKSAPLVDGLLAYPIPAHHFLNIETNYRNAAGAMLSITDRTGKEVFVMNLQNPQNEKFTLGLKRFAPGSYTLVVKTADGELARQTVIVQ